MRNVVVTGGALGIGAAIAREFIGAGERVTVLDIVKPDFEADYIRSDVSNIDEVKAAAESVAPMDIVVANAAIQTVGSFDSLDIADFKRVIDVNLVGAAAVINEFSKKMNSGRIWAISSVHGELPRDSKYAYDASKAALHMFVKESARALAKRGITVNALLLGATYTPMNAIFETDKAAEEGARAKVPLGVIMQPKTVAAALKALCGSEFALMTGALVPFDGGRSVN